MKPKIAIYPADGGGCGNYRMIWPGAAVRKLFSDQAEVLISADAPRIKLKWKEKFTGEPKEWSKLLDAEPEFPVDVMVFQRPLNCESVEVFRILRAKGIKIIIDLDDNFDRIDPKNAAWFGSAPGWHHVSTLQDYANRYGSVTTQKVSVDEEWHFMPEYQGRTHRLNIHKALKHSDLLITSTKSILSYYKRFATNSLVLENCIPESYLNIQRTVGGTDQSSTLGWTGTLATHPDDFKNVGSAIIEAKRKHDFTFKIIGDGIGIKEITGVEPDIVTGWVDIADYPKEFATLDVAICPLIDSQFNDSKSWLKPLEAAALGVVPIMSPSPEYLALNQRGVGIIASRPREWSSAMNKLFTNYAYMSELRAKGRAAAAELTVEKNAHKWLNAWTQVL